MNSVTVDELVMRIEVELDKFRAQAGQAEAIDASTTAPITPTNPSAAARLQAIARTQSLAS